MARATEAEIIKRIADIFPLVVDCMSLREIRAYSLAKTDWGAAVSEGQLKRYVASARQQMKQAAAFDRVEEIGAAKRRLERIIARSAAKGELRTQLSANRQLSDLLGLAAPTKVEHRGEIDIAALRRTLEEELAELIAAGRYEPRKD